MVGVGPLANIPHVGMAAAFLLIVVAIGFHTRFNISQTTAFERQHMSADGSHERRTSAAARQPALADARRATDARRIKPRKFNTAGARL
jgi:hypothetical protein